VFYRKHCKRGLDLLVSVPAAVALSPLIILIAVLVRIRLGRPVVFRQQRIGLGSRAFMLNKFRTMLDVRDRNGELLPDERRLTRFGAMLRRFSLDELPQLWNVIRGDMSLVGPRPLLSEYLDRYTPEQARRHEVTPGITGWAQVNGRNAITWEEKFELDVWYVDRVSLRLDVKILWLTLVKVFQRTGVSAENSATMPKFMGSKPP